MAEAEIKFDWTICIFCQKHTKELLQYPACGKARDSGEGYLTVSTNIQKFKELECIPMDISSVLLGDPHEIGDLFKENQARWYKNCCNKFNKMKLQRAEKRKSKDLEETTSQSSSKVTRRSCGRSTGTHQDSCFFCDESAGDLHKASTFNLDQSVRKIALELQDTILLAKLSAGDMVSQDAVYHKDCLTALYNKGRQYQSLDNDSDDSEKQLHGIALAELVAYIEETYAESEHISVFKLSDLTKLYQCRLEQLGLTFLDRVNSTHLKNRILSNFPTMYAHREGRDILLAFNNDIGTALKAAVVKQNYDSDALILKQAATIVRREILTTKSTFEGIFTEKCQQKSVVPSLLTLVEMILGGPSIQSQSNNTVEEQAALSISQLIQFNTANHRYCPQMGAYHSIEREPPLPIYLGILIHAETRKRSLIDKLYDLGTLSFI